MYKNLRAFYVPIYDRYRLTYLYRGALRSKAPITDETSGFGTIFLSTYPQRFESCVIALDGLSSGKMRPKRVVVFLTRPELPSGELPANLTALARRGVQFHFIEENWRVYNKLPLCHSGSFVDDLDAREDLGENPIITMDDDKIPGDFFISEFASAYKKFPGIVQSFVCQTIEFTKDYSGSRVRLLKSDSDKPQILQLTNGLGGVLYPRNAIQSIRKRGKDFVSVAPTNDDIWFRFCNIADDIACRQLRPRSERFPQTPTTQRGGINSVNFSRDQDGVVVNDRYFMNCIKYFGLEHLLPQ